VPPRYSRDQAAQAIAESLSWTEALRRLDRCPTGGAPAVLKKWAAKWELSTDHFDAGASKRRTMSARAVPLEQLLTERSAAKRGTIKKRLFGEGLKARVCELCGQGEEWNGGRMALILDHVNGIRDDNRLENLRIVCPNCNATLETHCGRAVQHPVVIRSCLGCGSSFQLKRPEQRYCSAACAAKHIPRDSERHRKVERPPLSALLEMVSAAGYEQTARELGVSSTSIRKWIVAYGATPPPGRGRDLHPPPPRPAALSDASAAQAIERLAQGESAAAVAAALGVSRYVIKDLKAGRTYRHIPRPSGLPRAA
jgi:transposase-like protein